MLHLSKSRYTKFWQCPKMLWLSKYKPEEEPSVDASTQARFDAGNEIGDLAMGMFGDFVEVTAYKEDESGELDLPKMIERTAEEMEKDTEIICEASFSFNGLYCAVDILKNEGDGWAIYEVKSGSNSKDVSKVPQYIADIAYQKYVLDNCGINVTGTYLVRLNSEYVLDGDLNLRELFAAEDVSVEVALEYPNVEPTIRLAERIMMNDSEPDIEVGLQCNSPYACVFQDYCFPDLPEPSVFDLQKIKYEKAMEFYKMGLADFKSLYESGEISGRNATEEKQLMQMEYEINDLPAHIDKEGMREFLDTVYYPLYFLDFETCMPAVPVHQGAKPYTQTTFQYSLHYIEEEGGELRHKEFLGEPGEDYRRTLAEALCRDIPENACVMVYNKSFEPARIKKMGEMLPDLAAHLNAIAGNIIDLMEPFQKGYYYNRAMKGSYSIKYVLPAVFPDDPELDYSKLEGIHNGDEAMNIFPKIKDMPADEAERARQNLLKYCELDTYAMVKLWQELVRVVG